MPNIQTKTKLLHDGMEGAPSLPNEYGALVSVLKTVLTEGFNEKDVINITTDRVKEEVTLHYSGNHGYLERQVITLSGVGNEKLDREHRVVKVSGDTLTIIVPSIDTIADSISGVKTRVSPLGFELAYDKIEEEGVACFKSKHKIPSIIKIIDKLPPNGYLNTWDKYVRVVAGTEIDSEGNFKNNRKTPRHSQFSDMELTGNGVSGAGGIHGYLKWDYDLSRTTTTSYSESSTQNRGTFPTNWYIVGDDKTFYLFIRAMGSSWRQYNICSFGHYDSDVEGDFILSGAERAFASNSNGSVKSGIAWGIGFTRTHSYEGNFIFHNHFSSYKPELKFTLVGINFGSQSVFWPSLATSLNGIQPKAQALVTSPVYVMDSNLALRGTLRGVRYLYGVNSYNQATFYNETDFGMNTKRYNGNEDNDTAVTYLFTLKDW